MSRKKDSPRELQELQTRAAALRALRQQHGVYRAISVTPHTEYQTRPLDWLEEKLRIPRETIVWSLSEGYERCGCARCEEAGNTGPHRWDGDLDPIARIFTELANGRDVGVESATGTGKTVAAALATMWFLACFENSLVYSVAPKEDQLLRGIWKEIGRFMPRFKALFPHSEYLASGKLRMAPAKEDQEVWAASAFVAGVGASEESATKAQGLHAEHMLIITEETPGIHPAIMEALENTRTDDHNLQLSLGNPDSQQDTLHQFCMQEHVVHLRISAFDHPNIVCGRQIIPGAIGPIRLERRIAKYGEGSRLYQSRVRGIAPAQSADALIRWEWCEAAAKRYDDLELREGMLAIGADPANSETGDPAAISRWQGACCTEVQEFPCPDASEFGRMIHAEATNPDAPVDPKHIGVDDVGVGASTVNELKRLGMRVRQIGNRKMVPGIDEDVLWSSMEIDPLEGKVKPTGAVVVQAEQFDRPRSQVWWRLREDLRLGRIALPYDRKLFEDLTTPTWGTKNGKICVESKEDFIKRLRRSPNKGDSVAYGNFVRRRIPLRTSEKMKLSNTRNRDLGLERMLAQKAKQQRKEDRAFQRMMRRTQRRGGAPV